MILDKVIDADACPLHETGFIAACRDRLAADGVITIPGFLRPEAVSALVTEAEAQAPNAYFTSSTHNVYLAARSALADEHALNRQITSSKVHHHRQVPAGSGLHLIYGSAAFRHFIAAVVGVPALFEYADPLSINVHYAAAGGAWLAFRQLQLCGHPLLQAPEAGGEFQYVGTFATRIAS